MTRWPRLWALLTGEAPILAEPEKAAIANLQTQKVGAIRAERQRILHERLRGYVDSQKGAT
ncbi:hypothetical protein K0U83_13200 [bacterium]|nr:hypothetical protein [bacterium]